MVESRQDKTNPCGRLISASERTMFNNLKNHLNIEDNPRSVSSIRYSWDNQRMDGMRIFARLDRMYLFRSNPSEATCHILEYRIHGQCPWSDHHPVVIHLSLSEGAPRKTRWVINRLWLDEAQSMIEQAWQRLPPNRPFFSKLKVIEHVYRRFCKTKAASFKEEEYQASSALATSLSQLQLDPIDPHLQHCHHTAQTRTQAVI